MSHAWENVKKINGIKSSHVVVPLLRNILLLDDHILYPNTPCTLYCKGVKMHDGYYHSTTIRERDGKERKKEDEVDFSFVI